MPNSAIENALAQRLLPLLADGKTKRIYVGVSGGVDSIVLLFLCKQFVEHHTSQAIELNAIHVHHGLSDFADHWQQHVINVCESWSVPLITQNVAVSNKGSLEEAARDSRYDVFLSILKDSDLLLLGHHQDDQVETMLQRLMRGSGLSGLLSMNWKRTLSLGNDAQATLVRPLLSISKKQIEQYAEHKQLSFVEDDSNTSQLFDRNFWRLSVLPLIGKRYPQYRQSVQASLNALQEEQSTLEFFLKQAVEQVSISNTCLALAALGDYPLSIQQQIIRHWLQINAVFPLPTQSQLNTICAEVIAARSDADPRFQWHRHLLARYRDRLYLLDESVLTIDHLRLPKTWQGEELDLGFATLQQSQSLSVGLKPDQYDIVWGNPGRSFRPLGRPSKTYKKLMQESEVPPWYRSHWPVLMKRGEVAAVPGICVCEGFAQDSGWQIELNLQLNKK